MRAIIIIWLMIIGAIMGSFLGCMGYRIPNKIKTTYPSSFCEKCKKSLKWYMNIPIISYIILGGKCYYCKEKIGSIYFICELLGLFLFPMNYIFYEFTINFFILTIFSMILIVTMVSDFKYYYISDRVLVVSLLALLITNYCFLDLRTFMLRAFCGVALFLIMFGLKIMGNQMFQRESLGDGDIKLMGVLAIGLGFVNSFISLFIASVIGLIFSLIIMKKNKEGIIPFGPFLIIGSMICLYLSNIITPYINELLAL